MSGDFKSFMGLAARAGKLLGGADACRRAIRRGKVKLVVLEADASANTIKEFTDACAYYRVPVIVNKTEGTLGEAVGRSANKVFGIVSPEFAGRLMEIHRDTSGGV